MNRALRVTLNFHPDRVLEGVSILRALAKGGVYRSQFETGTSNGGLSAHPGGDRWLWESRIFGSAYDNAPAAQRPKYGSLNYRGHLTGGAPRFGSAHFRLVRDTLDRTTFCYPDSAGGTVDFGVASRMSLIEKALAEETDALDDYIEAQVHGPVLLSRDAEALVLDPCFGDTEVEVLARELPCPVEWHQGFRLSMDELCRHPSYRGQEVVDVGLAIAQRGHVDARIIGDAARAGLHDEQSLKRVWHYVARFGEPPGGLR